MAFTADAAEAAKHGWSPSSYAWEGTTLTVVYQRQQQPPAVPLAAAPPVSDQRPSALYSYYGGKPPVALSAERTSDERDLRSAALWRPSSPEDVPLPPPSRADQLPRDNSGAVMTIAVGAAIAIGAGLISLVSYQDAEGGGTYVVLWGAVVAGVMISLHGLRDLFA